MALFPTAHTNTFFISVGQGDTLIADWTADYAATIAMNSQTGGASSLDSCSAALSNFLVRASLANPFHSRVVKDARQALRRAASECSLGNTNKAGMHFA